MATRTWTGASSGDFNATGNWAEGSVPVTGDDVIFDRGSRNLDTNLDQSAVTLVNVSFRQGYTGTAGVSVATPFKFGASGKLVIEGGAEKLFLSGGTIVTTIMRGCRADFSGEVHIAGTLTTVIFQRGLLYIESGTTTTLIQDPIGGGQGQATCYTSTATVTTLNQFGGLFNQKSTGTVTTLNNYGGRSQIDTGTLTTANLFNASSYVDWRSTTTLTTVKCYKGIFDASKQAAARTITNSEVHQGGLLNLYNGLDNITRTNNTIKYGGSVVDVAGTYAFSP